MEKNNFDLIRDYSAVTDNIAKEYDTGNGKVFKCVIKKLTSVLEMLEAESAVTKRQKAFETFKNALPVSVPAEVVAGKKDRFPGVVINGDKAEFKITNVSELRIATIIEQVLVEPKLSFNEAVILGRFNGALAAKIVKDYRSINEDLASQEAKNE